MGSLYVNNFTSISGILNTNSGSVWEFENSIFEGPATSKFKSSALWSILTICTIVSGTSRMQASIPPSKISGAVRYPTNW